MLKAQVYDFSRVSWTDMVEVFYTALVNGQQYPTDAQIEATGISHADLQFIKSHVRKRATLSNDGRLNQNTYAERKMWMNTPMGSGSGGDAGYPSKVFHSDVYSLWNYTSLWGSWNHSVCQIPGAWADAAHKNGTDMMSGSIFFDSGGGYENYSAWITRAQTYDNTSGVGFDGYKYVKPIIHMLRYFGFDGININWEIGSPDNYAGFHKALYKYAKQVGFNNFHLGIYTVSTSLASYNVASRYCDGDNQVADLMLNYGGEGGLAYSASNAKRTGIGTSGLWQGFWIVKMDQGWSYLNNGDAKEANICLWGEHKDSRFWSYNSGSSTYDQQDNYQTFLERAYSGGRRNPLSRPAISNTGNAMEWSGTTPPLSTFCGFSEWIPERSTVSGNFPFLTHFNLGNGDRYNYKGVKTAGQWYNMSAQDIVPTYRWLVTPAGNNTTASTTINVAFTHNDAYTGGSCLELKGDAGQATDIVLYRTNIKSNGTGAYANVAIKSATGQQQNSNLYLILSVGGTWREYAVPNNTGTTWQEHKIDLDLSASDVVDRVGLRVKGGSTGYDMYVGKLELNDANTVAPSAIQTLNATKLEETQNTMSFKLDWSVNIPVDEFGAAYNDAGNIDHFEVLYKNGADGTVREVGRTSQWADYIGALPIGDDQEPTIGVRAVSTDLKSFSEVVWKQFDRDANAPAPSIDLSSYGESKADKNAEGYQTAIKCRFVEKFYTTGATENVNYTHTYQDFVAERDAQGGLQYHLVENQTLKVQQGQTITWHLKGFDGETIGESDDVRWCFVGGWMDFDGSGSFNYGKGTVEQPFWKATHKTETNQSVLDNDYDPSTYDGTDPMGERIFRKGSLRGGNYVLVKNDGITGQVTIPADAHTGPSLLRIVYSDAWFAGAFGPTGNTNKGYTLDIPVVIEGTNPNQRGYVDMHDTGTPQEPEGIGTSVNNLKASGDVADVTAMGGVLYFVNTDKAWVYAADGRLMKELSAPTTVSARAFAAGAYIVKMKHGNVVTTKKIVL